MITGSIDEIWLHVEPANINFLNRIMEGYSHVGALTTVDRLRGIVFIRCTADTKIQADEIATQLPFPARRLCPEEILQYCVLGREE